MVVYDLETFNTDKAVPYDNCIHRLGKTSSKKNRDITEREYEKCRKDCNVFEGTDSINELLDSKNRKKSITTMLNIIYTYYLIMVLVSIVM